VCDGQKLLLIVVMLGLNTSSPVAEEKYYYDPVCLSVCDHIFGTTYPIFTKFLCILPMSMARSSSGGVAICYVLPVLWMASYVHTMGLQCNSGTASQQA